MKFTQPDKNGVSHIVLDENKDYESPCGNHYIYNELAPLTEEPVGTTCLRCRGLIENKVKEYKGLVKKWQKYLDRLERADRDYANKLGMKLGANWLAPVKEQND